jgi:hypothetical protein
MPCQALGCARLEFTGDVNRLRKRRMQRDILFLGKKFSSELLPQSAEFFVVKWGPLFATVENLAERIASLKPFIAGLHGETLFACGVRNHVESESEAIDSAFDVIEMLLAPYSFLTQDTYPEVSNVVLVREESSDDMYPRVFQKSGWMRWKAKRLPVTTNSAGQAETISDYLLGYFSYAFSKVAAEQTGLVEQLKVSMDMFRCGLRSRSTSAEFICKFIALEGLVCGESYHDARTAILENRLTSLCDKALPNIAELVGNLTKRRNTAFHHAHVNRAAILSYMETLDRLVLAGFVFAVSHLDKANSVEQLWSHVSTYQLPHFIFEQTPGGEFRAAILHGVLDPRLIWRGGGKFLDALYFNDADSTAKSVDA